ncbi:MAG: hypothetical protein KDA78_07020 [Planctomycetaceae bacterium]|nr:hypothetical protein [Planctomycetaceae bacterium]
MTTAGWGLMIISVGVVLAMTAFCLLKVLSLPAVEMDEVKGPLEIDTLDTSDAD